LEENEILFTPPHFARPIRRRGIEFRVVLPSLRNNFAA
jgi:hypothetical protein